MISPVHLPVIHRQSSTVHKSWEELLGWPLAPMVDVREAPQVHRWVSSCVGKSGNLKDAVEHMKQEVKFHASGPY